MTIQGLGTTEIPYRGVLLESLVIAEVYPGCNPLQFLAGQFSLEKNATQFIQASRELRNYKQRLEE